MASTGELTRSSSLEVVESANVGRRVLSDAFRVAGALCTAAMVTGLVLDPRWPWPDYLLVLAMFGFMSMGQALQLLRRLAPLVVLLLVYGAMSGIVPDLNSRVNYDWMVSADRWLTGSAEASTVTLQRWLWDGSPAWYDQLYFAAYQMHFVLPVLVIVLAWKLRPHLYGFAIRCYVALAMAGFVTYLAFPAAPPWLAAREGVIPPITRVSDQVIAAMEYRAAPTLWTQLPPNPVAAVPSLHAGFAVLFVALIWRMFGRRWALVAIPYPLIIFTGTVYAGEHYVIDEVLGAAYGLAAFGLVSFLAARGRRRLVADRSDLDGRVEVP